VEEARELQEGNRDDDDDDDDGGDRGFVSLYLLCQGVLDVPISSPLYPLDRADEACVQLLEGLARVLQSRQTLNLSSGFHFQVNIISRATARTHFSARPFAAGEGALPPLVRGNCRRTLWRRLKDQEEEEERDEDDAEDDDDDDDDDDGDDERANRGELVQEFSGTARRRIKEWTDNYRGMLFTPFFAFDEGISDEEDVRRGGGGGGDEDLTNCCLLVCLFMGLTLQEKLQRCASWKQFYSQKRDEDDDDWNCVRAFSRLKGDRRESEKDILTTLKAKTFSFARRKGLNVQKFKRGTPADILEQLELLGVNVYLYNRLGHGRLFYKYPQNEPFTDRPSVHLMALPVGRDGSGGTEDNLIWHAASVMIKPSSIFLRHKSNNYAWCYWCFSCVSKRSLHKCDMTPQGRQICLLCGKVTATVRDFISLSNEGAYCIDRPQDRADEKPCKKCGQKAKSTRCRIAHYALCKGKDSAEVCPLCYISVSDNYPHLCFHKYCFQCKDHYPREQARHECYLCPQSPPKYVDNLAVWDTETVNVGGNHFVNAVGLAFQTPLELFSVWKEKYFFSEKMNHEENDREPKTAFEYNPFQGSPHSSKRFKRIFPPDENSSKAKELRHASAHCTLVEDDDDEEDQTALEKFLDFILQPFFYNTTFLAHYGRGFDHLLLLNRLYRRQVKCEPIFDGHKLLQLSLPQFKMRFIDSHRYVPLPLSQLPKRFENINRILGENTLSANEKGIFPFKFNREEHYDYVGAIPGKEWFVDEFTTVDKEKKIEEFLISKRGQLYDFKKELFTYLKADVLLLAAAVCCLLEEFAQFQESIQAEKADDDKLWFHCFSKPFITLPQFIHALWRTYGLNHTLYLLANQTFPRKTSYGELEWLGYVKTSHPNLICASATGRQERVGSYYLDGYCPDTKTAFEFLGCLCHCHYKITLDCPLSKGLSCDAKNPFGESAARVVSRWRNKKKFLEEQGISVTYIWECQWTAMKKSPSTSADQERLKRYLERYEPPPRRLVIREALRGGRCEAFRLIYDRRDHPSRILKYLDINSLYPTVAIEKEFPTGKSENFVGEAARQELTVTEKGLFMKSYPGKSCLGLIKAKVLPPDSLFLPCLPISDSSKLIFGLCNACIKERCQDFCTHSDDQRCLTDVWTAPELAYAISLGYKVIEIHEAIVYRSKGFVFREFYSFLAKMKLISEPLPVEKDLESYVEELNRLHPFLNNSIKVEELQPNQSKRAFVKLCQNAGLGKLSQSEDKSTIKYFSTFEEFMNIRHDPSCVISAFHPIHDALGEAVCKKNLDLLGFQKNTQVIVYSHVTAYARIRLAQDMNAFMKRGCNIYYCDTGETQSNYI